MQSNTPTPDKKDQAPKTDKIDQLSTSAMPDELFPLSPALNLAADLPAADLKDPVPSANQTSAQTAAVNHPLQLQIAALKKKISDRTREFSTYKDEQIPFTEAPASASQTKTVMSSNMNVVLGVGPQIPVPRFEEEGSVVKAKNAGFLKIWREFENDNSRFIISLGNAKPGFGVAGGFYDFMGCTANETQTDKKNEWHRISNNTLEIIIPDEEGNDMRILSTDIGDGCYRIQFNNKNYFVLHKVSEDGQPLNFAEGELRKVYQFVLSNMLDSDFGMYVHCHAGVGRTGNAWMGQFRFLSAVFPQYTTDLFPVSPTGDRVHYLTRALKAMRNLRALVHSRQQLMSAEQMSIDLMQIHLGQLQAKYDKFLQGDCALDTVKSAEILKFIDKKNEEKSITQKLQFLINHLRQVLRSGKTISEQMMMRMQPEITNLIQSAIAQVQQQIEGTLKPGSTVSESTVQLFGFAQEALKLAELLGAESLSNPADSVLKNPQGKRLNEQCFILNIHIKQKSTIAFLEQAKALLKLSREEKTPDSSELVEKTKQFLASQGVDKLELQKISNKETAVDAILTQVEILADESSISLKYLKNLADANTHHPTFRFAVADRTVQQDLSSLRDQIKNRVKSILQSQDSYYQKIKAIRESLSDAKYGLIAHFPGKIVPDVKLADPSDPGVAAQKKSSALIAHEMTLMPYFDSIVEVVGMTNSAKLADKLIELKEEFQLYDDFMHGIVKNYGQRHEDLYEEIQWIILMFQHLEGIQSRAALDFKILYDIDLTLNSMFSVTETPSQGEVSESKANIKLNPSLTQSHLIMAPKEKIEFILNTLNNLLIFVKEKHSEETLNNLDSRMIEKLFKFFGQPGKQTYSWVEAIECLQKKAEAGLKAILAQPQQGDLKEEAMLARKLGLLSPEQVVPSPQATNQEAPKQEAESAPKPASRYKKRAAGPRD